MICLDHEFGTFTGTCDSIPGSFTLLIAAQVAGHSMNNRISGPFAPARKKTKHKTGNET
jgi:hypothetical protein